MTWTRECHTRLSLTPNLRHKLESVYRESLSEQEVIHKSNSTRCALILVDGQHTHPTIIRGTVSNINCQSAGYLCFAKGNANDRGYWHDAPALIFLQGTAG